MLPGACAARIECVPGGECLLTWRNNSRFRDTDIGTGAGYPNNWRCQPGVLSHRVIEQELINFAVAQSRIDMELAIRAACRYGEISIRVEFRHRQTRPARWAHDVVFDCIRVAGE